MGVLLSTSASNCSKLFNQVVTHFSDLSLVLWCYKWAVQRSLEDGKCARQGEHGINAQRDRGQDGIGSLQAKLPSACRWASLDKGTFMGVCISPPTVATRSLFLPFPFVWGFLFLGVASWYTVRMLGKPTALACPVDASSKLLADGRLWPPLAANAAPPAPYLANSLSSPYFRYANIWM